MLAKSATPIVLWHPEFLDVSQMRNAQFSTINFQGRKPTIFLSLHPLVWRLIAHNLRLVFAIGKE